MKNNKNHVYVLNVDASIDETLRKFQGQLAENEEIISTSISETKLVITTKIVKSGNLLTDELKRKGKTLI